MQSSTSSTFACAGEVDCGSPRECVMYNMLPVLETFDVTLWIDS